MTSEIESEATIVDRLLMTPITCSQLTLELVLQQ